jgi:hypothetical protein
MTVTDFEPSITDINKKINNLQTRVSAYQNDILVNPLIGRTTEKQAEIDALNATLQAESEQIDAAITDLLLKQESLYQGMEAQVPRLSEKINQLQSDYAVVKNIVYQNHDGFKATNEFLEVKITSNFYTYVVYLVITLFVAASLFYIQRNPEEKNLDMFILTLASFILAYYLYQYLQSNNYINRLRMESQTQLTRLKNMMRSFFGV